MDFLKQHLGKNKVFIPICSNEYEESLTVVEEDDLFQQLPDLYSRSKSHVVPRPGKVNPPPAKIPCSFPQQPPLLPQARKLRDFSKTETLVMCVLEVIDQTVTLLPIESLVERIVQFRQKIVSNIDSLSNRKHKVSIDQFNAYWDSCDIQMCEVFANLLHKTIAIKCTDEKWRVYGDFETCIIINDNGDAFAFDSLKSSDTVKKSIQDQRLDKHGRLQTVQKLNTMLLTDLKEIATELDIPLQKVDNGKKKNYLKGELRDLIHIKLTSI